jgi:hypothetical protein
MEHRVGAWLIVAIAVPLGMLNINRATTFVAMADGPCLDQPDLPRSSWPAWVDPNQVAGYLIDVQTVPAGKYNRVGPMCDPNNYPIDVELLQAPAGMAVTVDRDAGTWSIAGELPPGDYAIVGQGTNRPLYGEPNSVIVTIYVRATAPAVQKPRLY